nr:trypsin-1-like [Procambarus clarkii]
MYPISVTVGEHDLLDPSESPSQTLGVAYALFHADFGKEAQFDNDVAVLVLSAALDPRLNLMPACLPSPDYSVSGSVVTVVGWGATHEGGFSSNVLREAHIPVLQESTCQTSYPGSFLPEKMICAGYLVGRTDTCQGDSGGPVTHQESPTEPWTVVGVVSFGRGCARPGYPGVYTRITTFLPWLSKVMHLYP